MHFVDVLMAGRIGLRSARVNIEQCTGGKVMDAILKELAAVFGAYALLAVVAAWLWKTIMLESLKRERDSISSSLRQQADASLEQVRQQGLREGELLKQRLDIQKEQEKLRFSRVHERRSEIVSRLYSKLSTAYTAAAFPKILLNSGKEIRDQEVKVILEKSSEAIATFDDSRLFLPKHLEAAVDDILLDIQRPAYIYFGSSPRNVDELREWVGQFPAFDVKQKLEKLASEFREMLGVDI